MPIIEQSLCVQPVSPVDSVPAAGEILRTAWTAPALHYTDAYLRWQLRPVGDVEALAVMAYADQMPVGFAAAVPRQARWRSTSETLFLLSFVAVRPDWRRRGVALELYEELLDLIGQTGKPFVAFTIPDSGGERTLIKACQTAGWWRIDMGYYPGHGCLPRPAASPEYTVQRTSCWEDHVAVWQNCTAESCLWGAPDPHEWDHWQADPRPHVPLLLRDAKGKPQGSALALRGEVVTPQGVETVAMLERLYLPNPTSEALSALVHAAAQPWHAPQPPPVVLASNLWGIAPAILRGAGFRQTPAQFAGHLAAKAPAHPFFHAEGTNLLIT
ncbi:MAG: GNAT family N-acetyltransferase [Gemmataceae bacterium]